MSAPRSPVARSAPCAGPTSRAPIGLHTGSTSTADQPNGCRAWSSTDSTLRRCPGLLGRRSLHGRHEQAVRGVRRVRLRRDLRDRLSVASGADARLDDRQPSASDPTSPSAADGPMVYVGDTKYKVTTDGYARDRDYYQLLAYVTAMDLDEGLLVYCQDDGDPPPRQIEVLHAGKRLRTWAIRLDGSPRGGRDGDAPSGRPHRRPVRVAAQTRASARDRLILSQPCRQRWAEPQTVRTSQRRHVRRDSACSRAHGGGRRRRGSSPRRPRRRLR